MVTCADAGTATSSTRTATEDATRPRRSTLAPSPSPSRRFEGLVAHEREIVPEPAEYPLGPRDRVVVGSSDGVTAGRDAHRCALTGSGHRAVAARPSREPHARLVRSRRPAMV